MKFIYLCIETANPNQIVPTAPGELLPKLKYVCLLLNLLYAVAGDSFIKLADLELFVSVSRLISIEFMKY